MTDRKERKPGISSTRLTFNIVAGLVFMIAGIMMALWAQSHSPNIGIGEAMMKGPNHWILAPGAYYFVMGFAALLGIVGVLGIIQTFMKRGK